MKKVLFVLVLAFGLAGCASLDKGRQVKYHGLIMDFEGKGVAGYHILQREKIVSHSNDSGYFDLDAVYGMPVSFLLKKNGWESLFVSEEMPVFNSLHVFKVRDVDSVCRQIEESLDSNEYEKIDRILEGLPEEFLNNRRVKYLTAVKCYRQRNFAKAVEEMNGEIFVDVKDASVQAFIQMLKEKEEIDD